MSLKNEHFIVKKYANRRLYNTQTSCYVSLADIFDMVKRGENFSVIDVKTDEDITHSILVQVIFDQESKGINVLPTDFLRQIIRFYGNSGAPYVTEYLSRSMGYFTENQDRMQNFFTAAKEGMTPGFMRSFLEMQTDYVRKAWSFPLRTDLNKHTPTSADTQSEDEKNSDNNPKG